MKPYQQEIAWTGLLGKVGERAGYVDISGLHGASVAYALTQIHSRRRMPMAIVVETAKEAEILCGELRFFSRGTDTPVHYFAPYNISPYRFLAYNNETAARRIRTLYQLVEGHSHPFIVTTASALMQKLLPKQALIDFTELVLAQEDIDLDSLVQTLVAGGYSRAMIVEEPGDFAVRGGILDLFSPLYSDPLRIELFGDTVESVRLFSADTQRTVKELDEAVIPARA